MDISTSYLDPAKTFKSSIKLCEMCSEDTRTQRINVVVDGEIVEWYDLCDSNACFRLLESEVL